MAAAFIIIAAVIIMAVVFNSKSSKSQRAKSNSISKTAVTKNPITPYHQETIELYIKGIWAEKSRINEFRSLESQEFVDIQFEKDNPRDKNAIAVYSKKGVKLGYIPRNRRKLILTLRSNPNILGRIILKEEFFSKKKERQVYSLYVRLWVGFEKDVLIDIESNIHKSNDHFVRFVNLSSELRELKKDTSSSAINRLLELSLDILDHNQKAGIDHQIKIPLDNLTALSCKMNQHHQTIEFYELFFSKTSLTEKQREKVVARVEKARSIVSNQLPPLKDSNDPDE